jgi:hypothetical protein
LNVYRVKIRLRLSLPVARHFGEQNTTLLDTAAPCAIWVNGAPRQKHLAYLGGIAEDMKANAEARRTFWSKVTAALDALKKLKPEDRQKIEKSLAARVPPPTNSVSSCKT